MEKKINVPRPGIPTIVLRIRAIFPVLTVLLIFLASTVSAETRRIIIGEQDQWRDMQFVENITFTEGKRGYLDAVLRDEGPVVEDRTDLLIDFDTAVYDASRHYRISSAAAGTNPRAAIRGEGGGVFAGAEDAVVLEASAGAALAANQSWSDFTIDFWLYPVLLDEGATIFSWIGARRGEDTPLIESIRVYVSERRLKWDFDNVFLPADSSPFSIHLTGSDVLVPRRWHHHMFRYTGETGLAEYLVDGELVDLIHTTPTGNEESEVYAPYTGDLPNTISIGSMYTGYIDEFRVSTDYIDRPVLHRFPDRVNEMTSRVFDLDYTNTRLIAIDADYTEPGNSTALFYYRIGETLASISAVDSDWIPFTPSPAFVNQHRGRYLQIRVELLPDGDRESSPRIHSLSIAYEPDLPPHPPEHLRALAADGEISITWNRSLDADVSGYLVYYGTRSMWYFGDDSDSGPSPVDVGDADTFTLTGLKNGTLYYIAVVAYDSGTPPHQSEFSAEISARPTRTTGNR